ncbi:FtsX-like permease family protein [Pontiella sp.]|uniref:FtsX-like permease family protein n=1 Tax=Pontiella sp. TaxID=2837462 RepID=UPI0035654360
MKLLISIGSYLLKDIFWRWREQPGNVLTRFVVAYALVLPSLGLLGAFALMAENLEMRLTRNGIDMLFITEHIGSTSDDFVAHQLHPALAPLRTHGTMFQLLQLFGSVRTPNAGVTRAVAYPDASLPYLLGMVTPEVPVVFLSDTLPVGMPVRAEIDDYFFSAQVRRPTGMVSKIYQQDVVLVPEGMLPRQESRGFSRVTLFKADRLAALRGLEEAIKLMTEIDKQNVSVRSSLKLLGDLDRLKEKQVYWRFGLALTAGGVLALVLGTLAVLEYQQRAYVIALLRSFGIRRWMVYGMQLLENAFVVNVAAVASYLTLAYFQQVLYKSFGQRTGAGLSIESMFSEILVIFVCINVGVVISTLPALHILKKDVGTILS